MAAAEELLLDGLVSRKRDAPVVVGAAAVSGRAVAVAAVVVAVASVEGGKTF